MRRTQAETFNKRFSDDSEYMKIHIFEPRKKFAYR